MSKGLDMSKPVKTATEPLVMAGAMVGAAQAVPPAQKPSGSFAPVPARRPFTMQEVTDFGRNQTLAATSAAGKINSAARLGDIDEVGKALGELLVGAGKYDVQKLGRSKGFFGFFKRKKRELEAHYKSVDQQVNTLVGDVERQITHFRGRVGDLENLRDENHNRHASLGYAIQEANERIEWMRLNPPEVDTTNAMSAKNHQTWMDVIAYAEKRVDDLRRAQVMCEMIDAQIDMMIKNASALVLKFGEVKTTTVPQLQMGFALYIANLEAERGADFATEIDNTNNRLMAENAAKLGVATVKVASAMSRSSIDLATLQTVKEHLFKTGDEMKRISDETAQRLKSESVDVEAISQELVDRYTQNA